MHELLLNSGFKHIPVGKKNMHFGENRILNVNWLLNNGAINFQGYDNSVLFM